MVLVSRPVTNLTVAGTVALVVSNPAQTNLTFTGYASRHQQLHLGCSQHIMVSVITWEGKLMQRTIRGIKPGDLT